VRSQILKQGSKINLLSHFPFVRELENSLGPIITISVSTDGFPVCKSSNVQMWPILFKIDQASLSPILARLYCGEGKPGCILEFLNVFVV